MGCQQWSTQNYSGCIKAGGPVCIHDIHFNLNSVTDIQKTVIRSKRIIYLKNNDDWYVVIENDLNDLLKGSTFGTVLNVVH